MTNMENRWVQVASAVVPRVSLPIWNLDGVDWLRAPTPRRWHRCRPQSKGVLTHVTAYRCACGALSFDCEIWIDRNSKRRSA